MAKPKKKAAKKAGAGGAGALNQSNVERLAAAGLISPEYLSAAALAAINKLTEAEVDALISIGAKVDLGTFFKARGPQQG